MSDDELAAHARLPRGLPPARLTAWTEENLEGGGPRLLHAMLAAREDERPDAR